MTFLFHFGCVYRQKRRDVDDVIVQIASGRHDADNYGSGRLAPTTIENTCRILDNNCRRGNIVVEDIVVLDN